MKCKEIIFLIIVLLFFSNAFSQSATSKITEGLNISNYKYTININDASSSYYNGDRVSTFFGLGVEKSIRFQNNNNFLINGELQYSQQGNSFDSEFIGNQTNFIHQINLLLTLKLETIKNIYLGGGFYTGYLVYVDEYYREDEDTHKNFDFGLVGSFEYRFFKRLSIEVRYLYGVSDILDREFDSSTITHDKYNKVVQIGLNYMF